MSTRCELIVAACLALVAGTACKPQPPVARPTDAEPPPSLRAPAPLDPKVRGAAFLNDLAAQLQPEWAQFLEDCRTRLPAAHALNSVTLAATAELEVDRLGGVRVVRLAGSGNRDFDHAVRGVVHDVSRLEVPDEVLVSDDDKVHIRWLFARDQRQAGAATAEVFTVELPLLEVVERRIAKGDLSRAIARITRAPETDPARASAVERVMIEILRQVVGEGSAPGARRVAVEAIGRARITALAPEVRKLLSPTTATELRLAAITTAAKLGDRDAVPDLAGALLGDLAGDPRLALAESEALVALGQQATTEAAIRRALEKPSPPPAALSALAVVAIPALDGKLATWFARRDTRVRAAVCTGITRVAARPVALRGLRDADATVRAACLDAIARIGPERAGGDVVSRVRELTRDRDRSVRVRAIVALDVLKGGSVPAAADDPAPEVRAAAVLDTSDAKLAVLASDQDPDVRAAAVGELGKRIAHHVALAADPDPATRAAAVAAIGDKRLALVAHAAADQASQVRRAAVPSVTDLATLERLAADDTPEVAHDAQIALVQRRGRTASTAPSLARLAASPGELERVRIALAWLLATRP